MLGYKSIHKNNVYENYSDATFPTLTLKGFVSLCLAFCRRPCAVRPIPYRGQKEFEVIPVKAMSAAKIEKAPDMSLWKIGHSTVLIKLARGKLFLTDPIFSERASPVQWLGPRRFSRLPITIAELARVGQRERPITGVLISHDHYDHLDQESIVALAPITEMFFVPMRLGPTLEAMGVAPERVRELDWWDMISLYGGDLQLVCTPTHHYSKRSIWGRCRTLWCSWCIIQNPPTTRAEASIMADIRIEKLTEKPIALAPESYRIYFSGDSGWHRGFKAIGDAIGPFDVTLLENGQYNSRHWHSMHMRPSETGQAHISLRGKWLIPIHNCTFDLSVHPWFDPLVKIEGLAHKLGFQLCTPIFGERVDLLQMNPGKRWWQSLTREESTTAGTHNSSLMDSKLSLLQADEDY